MNKTEKTPEESQNEEIFKELASNDTYDLGNKESKSKKRGKGTLQEKLKILFKKYKKDPRAWGILVTAILLPILFAVFAVVFGYDSYAFPSSIQGRVIVENTQIPIQDATISIEQRFFVRGGQSEIHTTNDDGIFEIHNLHNGLVRIKVQAEGFDPFDGQVQLERGTNTVNIRLTQVDFAQVQLQLVAEEDYDFSTSVFSIRGVEYALTDNGFLYTDNLPIGTLEIAFSSPDYVDFKEEIDLHPGMNKLDDFVLTPSGDIVLTLRNWVTQTPLAGRKVSIHENTQSTSQAGKVAVRDLTVGETISITSSTTGFIHKEVEVEINQGINNSTLDLVPEGKVIYVSNRTGSGNVYASNYDGSDEQLLTTNSHDANYPLISNDGTTVNFYSTVDGLTDTTFGFPVSLPYSVEISGANIQKLYTSPTIPYGTSFFPRSGLMASHSDFILSYGPISGNDQQNIVNLEGDGYIYNVRISDDGSTLYYITTAHENPAKNGLYLYDLTTGENSIIAPGATWSFDVTQDGNKVLYEYSEPGVDSDSYVYDRTTEEETQLTRGSSETFFLQFSNDGATVFFISLRDAKSNIYSIPSAGGSESQITQTGDVAAIQLGNSDVYMFYYTIEALFVTAVDTTGEAREVSNNVLTPLVPEFPGNF